MSNLFILNETYTNGLSYNFLYTISIQITVLLISIKIFSLLVGRYSGSLVSTPSMLFALIFVFMFTIGGLSGVVLANASLDIAFHDTYYVVTHFYYGLSMGAVFVLYSAWYFWIPKMLQLTYADFYYIIYSFFFSYIPYTAMYVNIRIQSVCVHGLVLCSSCAMLAQHRAKIACCTHNFKLLNKDSKIIGSPCDFADSGRAGTELHSVAQSVNDPVHYCTDCFALICQTCFVN